MTELARQLQPDGSERVRILLDTPALIEKYGAHCFKLGDETEYTDYSGVKVLPVDHNSPLALAEREEKRIKAAPAPLTDDVITLRLEVSMLRRFYEQWEALHAVPKERDARSAVGKENAKRAEAAASALLETAHAIRAFRGGLNG